MGGQKFEDLNPAVVGEPLDQPLETFGSCALPPDHAFFRFHTSPTLQIGRMPVKA
jgi:hypothetical protein